MQQEAFIHLCAKFFFIVEFDLQEDHDLIFNSGSWFWGNSCSFMKPWSPSFNPTTHIISSAPVWVRLPNMPPHFWGLPSLEAIGLALGKFHFTSHETTRHNTSTFSHICMEMDFSKGFLVEVILTGKYYSLPQKLDFERVSLCYRSHCPKEYKKFRKHHKSTWWVGSNDDHQVIPKACKESPQDNENPPLLSQDPCQNSTEKMEKDPSSLQDSNKGIRIQQSP
jgi:hypothetical protein